MSSASSGDELEVEGAKDLLDGIDRHLAASDSENGNDVAFDRDHDDLDSIDTHSLHFTQSEVEGPPDVSELIEKATTSAANAQAYAKSFQDDATRQDLLKHAISLQQDIERLRVRDKINQILKRMSDASSEDEVVQARLASDEVADSGCQIS